MLDNTTKLQNTLIYIHFYVQLMQKKKVSYAEMAKLGGVSQRTFAEWMRGGCSPGGVEAVLKMLALLPSDQIEKAIEVWKPTPPNLNKPRKKSRRNGNEKNINRNERSTEGDHDGRN